MKRLLIIVAWLVLNGAEDLGTALRWPWAVFHVMTLKRRLGFSTHRK